MNVNDVPVHLTAPLAFAVGILSCFWGYRLVKLTLGLMGFIAGASAGWAVGLSLAPHNSAIALVCAVIAGVIGAILCVWLFFFGIFLLGASAGAVVGAAVLNAAGQPAQPLPVLVLAFAFGLIALVLQKFMIIISTAFSGSYLITAALVHLLTGVQEVTPLWFERLPGKSPGALDYVALGLWLVLGLIGVRFQYRGSRGRDKAAGQEGQPA